MHLFCALAAFTAMCTLKQSTELSLHRVPSPSLLLVFVNMPPAAGFTLTSEIISGVTVCHLITCIHRCQQVTVNPIGVPRKRRRPKASSDSGPVRTAPTGSSQYPTHGSRCTGPTGRLEAHLVASRFQLPLLPGHQRLLDRFRLLP